VGTTLADLSRALGSSVAKLEPLQHAAGRAGKDAALAEIKRALGADSAMSGLKRRVRLGAGYDLGDPVVLNLRPKGLVILADPGRKRTKQIIPRGRGRGRTRALSTPYGPRASSTSTPSRGSNLIAATVKRCGTDVPRAVSAELDVLFIRGGLK